MIIRLSFLFAVFCSIISQIPSVLESSWGDPLKYTWVLPALLLLFKRPKEYFDRPVRWFVYFIFAFGLYCALFDAFTMKSYVGRDFYNISISFLIFSVSYKCWRDYGHEQLLKHVAVATLVSGFLLAFFLYVNYLEGSDVLSRIFAYNYGKNQASMIVLCGLLMAILNLRFKKKWFYVIEFVIVAFMFYIVVLLRSRSTFVGVFYVIYYFIFRIHNRKLTIFTIVLSVTAIIVVLSSPYLYHIVVDGILFAGRDATDLNELSSGRVYKLNETWEIFVQNTWFGNGNIYMDCMPIAMLAQYGVVGASIVFSYLFFMGKKIFAFEKSNNIYLTAYLFFNVLMLNSLFEGQPPFGPGVKCFMLWMMLGFSFADMSNKKEAIIAKKRRKELWENGTF